jgi:hypothetical protein
MSETTSARPLLVLPRTFAFVVVVLVALGAVGACSEAGRSNGDSCLKDEDCLSGICEGQLCVASPTLLLDATTGGDSSASDASEAAAETAPPKDSSPPKEAAPAEAAAEASPETGSGDATGEATTD